MTISGVNTFIIFDPMTHTRQLYVLVIFLLSQKFKLIEFECKGILVSQTMDQMALAHSLHNTRAITFAAALISVKSWKGKLKVL